MKLLNWIVILCLVETYVVAQEAPGPGGTTNGQPTSPVKNQNETATIKDTKDAKPVWIELAEGKVVLEAPKEWKRVEPRFPQMVQYEFHAPADTKEVPAPVRITVMVSGGGVEGNLQRWYGQFTQPDGKATEDLAKLEEFEVDGQRVYFVNITGTYSGGMARPGQPQEPKENYQLSGAILPTEKHGVFFITATGPSKEVQKLTEGFREMLKKLKTKS